MTRNLTEQQLDRLIYAGWDFQQALSALTFLLEDCDFDARYTPVQLRRFRCYETTVIVSFARPFEVGRGNVALGLRAIGFEFETDEAALRDRLIGLRNTLVAHSDDSAMHFRTDVHEMDEGLGVPEIVFDEGLQLQESELGQLELLLRKLKHSVAGYLFDLAQADPARLQKYKRPRESA